MADTSQTSKALLAVMPSKIALQRSGGHQGARGKVEYQTVRDMMLQGARAKSRALSGYGVLVDGTTISTITDYRVNVPAGEALVDGEYDRAAIAVDATLLGAAVTIPSFDLAGAQAVVIPDDGDSVRFAIVEMTIASARVRRGVFGAIAADASELAPTEAQIGTALRLAAETNADLTVGVIIGRGKVARAGGAVTVTGVDPTTDDGLKAEQSIGTLLNLPTP